MGTRILPLSLLSILLAVIAAPTVSAGETCDITATKCWVNGGKCNIQFKNKTGDSGGSDGGTALDQRSSAQTIQVKAKKENNNNAGNTLSIDAGASSTMNIEKKYKKNFYDIKIKSKSFDGTVGDVTMSCSDIKAVLNGNGTCKVFHGVAGSGGEVGFYMGYQCDGGNVAAPADMDETGTFE